MDFFQYEIFHRVEELLRILTEASHPMAKYLSCIVKMLNGDEQIRQHGLRLFKEIATMPRGLFRLKMRRKYLLGQLRDLNRGMFALDFNIPKFCNDDHIVGMDDIDDGLCFSCLADQEVLCYSRAYEFHTAIDEI